jgi:hypothetical protein
VIHKSLLERVESVGRFQPSMVRTSEPFGLNRQDQAGVHGLAVQNDRAGTALTHIAAFLCPGELKIIAQHVDKGSVRLNGELLFLPFTLRVISVFISTSSIHAVWLLRKPVSMLFWSGPSPFPGDSRPRP